VRDRYRTAGSNASGDERTESALLSVTKCRRSWAALTPELLTCRPRCDVLAVFVTSGGLSAQQHWAGCADCEEGIEACGYLRGRGKNLIMISLCDAELSPKFWDVIPE
jgi:hypothetical protein